MIVVKILAGIVIFLTVAIAIVGQFFDVASVPQEMQATDAQAVIGTEPPVEVQRTPGAVVCKFDPVTDSPQQFAADYLFGELFRSGDIYTFSARVAVPSGGYTVSFGSMTMIGNQVILEANLNRPKGQALEMIDTVGLYRQLRFPPEALTLRVALKRNFAWGPDAIVCSIMRPAAVAPSPPPAEPFLAPPASQAAPPATP